MGAGRGFKGTPEPPLDLLLKFGFFLLMLYVPVNYFSVMSGGFPVYLG